MVEDDLGEMKTYTEFQRETAFYITQDDDVMPGETTCSMMLWKGLQHAVQEKLNDDLQAMVTASLHNSSPRKRVFWEVSAGRNRVAAVAGTSHCESTDWPSSSSWTMNNLMKFCTLRLVVHGIRCKTWQLARTSRRSASCLFDTGTTTLI